MISGTSPNGDAVHAARSCSGLSFSPSWSESAALIAFGLHNQVWWVAVAGIGVLVIGPLVVRLLTESMIVVFRINETLTDLRSLAMWGADQASGADAGGAWQDPSPSTATRAT